ncbi:hypothetical protein BU16DRAFT_534036 [Lophium mytilinum]|uniref:Uncharacterized protein n=1 Tax=Lophium mytilinum TaxID=390894 RepID=A0A6A6RC92_9PEZI|nr:hypothetical protein BU16DRAFT_534036 [Lophium mytilinum]
MGETAGYGRPRSVDEYWKESCHSLVSTPSNPIRKSSSRGEGGGGRGGGEEGEDESRRKVRFETTRPASEPWRMQHGTNPHRRLVHFPALTPRQPIPGAQRTPDVVDRCPLLLSLWPQPSQEHPARAARRAIHGRREHRRELLCGRPAAAAAGGIEAARKPLLAASFSSTASCCCLGDVALHGAQIHRPHARVPSCRQPHPCCPRRGPATAEGASIVAVCGVTGPRARPSCSNQRGPASGQPEASACSYTRLQLSRSEPTIAVQSAPLATAKHQDVSPARCCTGCPFRPWCRPAPNPHPPRRPLTTAAALEP